MVRSRTMCGKQQHLPSSIENSWWWKIRCPAAFFRLTLNSQESIWYFFPAAVGVNHEPGWKKYPAFFCVWVTSFLCRWALQKSAMHCELPVVSCAEKRDATCIYWNCCIPKSKSGQQMHKREKAELLQACSGEDYSASQLPCPLCRVFTPVKHITPALTVMCRILTTANVQCF